MGNQETRHYYDDTQEGFNNLKHTIRDISEQTWREDGACWGSNPDVFFPNERGPQATKAAKMICETCQVRDKCDAFAVPRPELVGGTWAGRAERERTQIRKSLQLKDERKAS